jgi:capsular exopolysaccharide synthesis family protein
VANIIHSLPERDGIDDWKVRLRALPCTPSNGAALFPFDNQDRCASEQYRILRTKVAQHGSSPQLLAISSPQTGDGKTVTAINLAAALAVKSGAGVLLVDADLRRSAIALKLGLPPSPGLRDVLQGRSLLEDAVIKVELTPNLYVLPAGEKGGNPAELFDGAAWQHLCRRLRTSFQSVVIDTTPVGVVADYELIQAQIDAVILVVRPDHTDRDRFYRALKLVSQDKLLGVICNCVPDSFGSRGSFQDYRYYRSEHD